jgi:hypothetical protein
VKGSKYENIRQSNSGISRGVIGLSRGEIVGCGGSIGILNGNSIEGLRKKRGSLKHRFVGGGVNECTEWSVTKVVGVMKGKM